MGGSSRDRIFVGGLASPVLDEYGIPRVGLIKGLVDSQLLARLAIATTNVATKPRSNNAFFMLPTPKGDPAKRNEIIVDKAQDAQPMPIRAKL